MVLLCIDLFGNTIINVGFVIKINTVFNLCLLLFIVFFILNQIQILYIIHYNYFINLICSFPKVATDLYKSPKAFKNKGSGL